MENNNAPLSFAKSFLLGKKNLCGDGGSSPTPHHSSNFWLKLEDVYAFGKRLTPFLA